MTHEELVKKAFREDSMVVNVADTNNPFTDFETWWKNDYFNLFDTCGLLARLAPTDNVAYSDEKNNEIISNAMVEMVERWPHIFKIVVPSDYK